MNPCFILGAPDPEMSLIEALVREVGCDVLYAAAPGRDGALARCHAGNAYVATGALPRTGRPQPLPDGGVWVECAPLEGGRKALDARRTNPPGATWAGCRPDPMYRLAAGGAVRVDHHAPGDPGYGHCPGQFLEASSVGQTVDLLAKADLLNWRPCQGCGGDNRVLGWDMPYPRTTQMTLGLSVRPAEGNQWRKAGLAPAVRLLAPERLAWEILHTAAADHCLAAAFAGQCPGILPEELASWRDASRAAWQRRPVEAVRADRERAEAAILVAPKVALPCPACRGSGWATPSPLTFQGEVPCGPCGGFGRGPEVRDLRGLGEVPEAPEACARLGEAILYRLPAGHPANRGPRAKIGLLGAGEGTQAGTAPVEAFLAAARRGQLLGGSVADAYPECDGTREGLRQAAARGFAGCYEEDGSAVPPG